MCLMIGGLSRSLSLLHVFSQHCGVYPLCGFRPHLQVRKQPWRHHVTCPWPQSTANYELDHSRWIKLRTKTPFITYHNFFSFLCPRKGGKFVLLWREVCDCLSLSLCLTIFSSLTSSIAGKRPSWGLAQNTLAIMSPWWHLISVLQFLRL